MMQYYQDPMMFNPYADMLGGGYGYDPSQQEEFARMLAEQERQRQEQQEQQNSSMQDFGDQLSDYMNQGQTPTMDPTTTMGATPGMSSSAAVNAAGGTLQSSAAAPLAQSAPLASQTMLSGGGSVVGPMSQAPVAGMSMAPGATGGATVAGTTTAGTAAAPAAAAAAPSAAAAGGAGAGAGAAGGAGAGAAMAAAAPWLAIPAAALGSMQWTNNTNDDVSWGDWVTNPGNAHDALGGNFDDLSTRILGDNMLGGHVGDFLGAPADVLFPSSPGDFFEGVGDTLLLNQSGDLLKEAGSWIGDLFGGLF